MLKNLDFLRAVAVLMVFWGHWGIRNFPQTNGGFSVAARMGVLLFFVHTSYVLMLSLARLMDHHKNFVKSALTFYIRRVFRIYPLAMVCVTIATLLGYPYITVVAEGTKGTYLANLFLIQNLVSKPESYGVLWTLPIELQMYLFLPFCFVLARRSVRHALIAGALSLCAGILASLHPDAESTYYFFSPALYAPCFAAGMLAYTLTLHHPNLKKIRGIYWAPSLVGFIFILILVLPLGGRDYVGYRWVASLGVGLLVSFYLDMGISWLSRASYQVAKYSYGIYLLHSPIMTFTHNNWLGATVLTAIVSVVVYHLIESPLVKIGKKLTSKESDNTDTLLSVPAP